MKIETMAKDKIGRGLLFLKHLLQNKADVADEEVKPFRAHPAQIYELTASTYVHRALLPIGVALGAIPAFLPKLTQRANRSPVSSGLFSEFAIVIIVTMNAALDKS